MLLLPPDRSLKKPLQSQLLEQLQDLIHSGRLAPLARMPATRELAAELRVSRTTVVLVYDELIAEGYLQTEPAVGTFVSRYPPGAAARPAGIADGAEHHQPEGRPGGATATPVPNFDFCIAAHDARLFPHKAWRGLLSRLLREGGWDRACEGPAGLERLRRAIARWNTDERGLPTAANQIVIVSGLAQAQQILARLLLRHGETALVDRHFPQSVVPIFADVGAQVEPLRLEDVAPARNWLEAGGRRVALICLASPSGAPAEARLSWWKRRERLLERPWLADAIRVEYEGADHGSAPMPPPGGAPATRVIRLAVLSPTLSYASRLAYMVMPPDLVEAARALRASLEDGRSWLEEMALACFIEEGAYARHVRRVNKIYLMRRAALIDALRRHFPAPELDEPGAADHIRWRLPPDFPSAMAVRDRAASCGISLEVAEDDETEVSGGSRRTLCLGYGRMDEEQIAAGVATLAGVIAGLGVGDRRVGRQKATTDGWGTRDFA